jgi:hypothetical protein
MWIAFSRFGKFSVIILLSILWMPLACTYFPSSMPVVLKFSLLMDLVNFCIFISQVLSCLTNNSSVFHLIFISSSSSEILLSACSSLLEWLSTVFVFLFHYISEVFYIVGHFLFNIVYFCL